MRKSTLAVRVRARTASGWFVPGGLEIPIGNPAPPRALVPPGQKSAGVSCELASRVAA
jgi:hypothetical protein